MIHWLVNWLRCAGCLAKTPIYFMYDIWRRSKKLTGMVTMLSSLTLFLLLWGRTWCSRWGGTAGWHIKQSRQANVDPIILSILLMSAKRSQFMTLFGGKTKRTTFTPPPLSDEIFWNTHQMKRNCRKKVQPTKVRYHPLKEHLLTRDCS